MNIISKKILTIKCFIIANLFILSFIFYAFAKPRICGAADHIWTLMIKATGQVIEDSNVKAYNIDMIYIGINTNEERFIPLLRSYQITRCICIFKAI